jgi:hypothetical protein
VAGKNEPITFTRGAAERIANAVRKVEIGERNGGQLEFEPVLPAMRRAPFKVCTFTGEWAKLSLKTVTFKYMTTTPNTVAAMNLFAQIATSSSATRNCAIARDGTAWYLIAAEC